MKKVNKRFLPNRRQVLKAGFIAGIGMMAPWRFLPARVFAASAIPGLSDPALQPKFVNPVPDALAPGFKYVKTAGSHNVRLEQAIHQTGLVGLDGVTPLETTIWGYNDLNDTLGPTWPGKTFEIQSGSGNTEVVWENGLGTEHILPVDTNLHWCYSLHDYMTTIADSGVPVITHLHGGHTDFQFDGNPEFFYSPDAAIKGPQWYAWDPTFNPSQDPFLYDNNVMAGSLWYHDHALGITRLNVYAGLAGFYFIRDAWDRGVRQNPLGLPAWPYEKAYAIQDRMFRDNGELFYPAFPGDPAYADFITGEDAVLPPGLFPGGGPTGLAEFFGDHMVVNGKIWPKEDVEPRNYRLRLLNGTDSRFMAIRFRQVELGVTAVDDDSAPYIPFHVIGSDQGLADQATEIAGEQYLLFEPGSRYDIVIDFSRLNGKRVVMENIGGDEPFGGEFGEFAFDCTNRIMAFDVITPKNKKIPDKFNVNHFNGLVRQKQGSIVVNRNHVDHIRKVALFEGKDEFGRLQPLLGTAEPATDFAGNDVNWPTTDVYQQATLPDGTPSPLTGPIEGSVAWHSPTTENPALNTTEEWEIWNMTGDAHPIHLHQVHFEVLGRQEIVFDSNVDEDGFIPDGVDPARDGVYRVPQPTVQHNSFAGDATTYGMGFKIVHPPNPDDAYGPAINTPPGVVENTPKDMVTALPGQITRIKATFDKPGRYVWHCHILSHEDHEMMRVMHVGEGA